MNNTEVKALVERDPEAGAAYILDALNRGDLDNEPAVIAARRRIDAEFAAAQGAVTRGDKRARIADTFEYTGLRVLAGAGIALCFIVYCVLRLLRPFVRIACGLLIFLLSIGGAIAYFVHQATGVQALIMAGVVVACFAVRELYDFVVVWFGLRGHAAM